MTNNRILKGAARTTGRVVMVGLAAAIAFSIGGCHGILEVDNKDAVTDAQFAQAGGTVAPALLTGVVQQFAIAYDFVIEDVGVYSDELSVLQPSVWGLYTAIDSLGTQDITFTNNQIGNISEPNWNTLQAARVGAEKVYSTLVTAGQESTSPLAGQALIYAGMSYMFLGELTCDVAFDGGPAMPPVKALNKADSLLAKGLALAVAANLTTGTKDFVSLAHLMRARVLMDLGSLDAAATEAALVKAGFSWLSYPVVAGGQSWVYFHTVSSGFPTSTTGPAFRNSIDPRVPVVVAKYQTSTTWDPTKYPKGDTPQILGNYAEALLIQAEVQLGKGNVATAMTLINTERALTPGLAALSTSSSSAEATTYLRSERGSALFLQGRRLVDLQRWGQKPPEYFGTANFSQVCIPVPQTERDNNYNLGTLHSARSITTFTAP